jgi:hypothetical protein
MSFEGTRAALALACSVSVTSAAFGGAGPAPLADILVIGMDLDICLGEPMVDRLACNGYAITRIDTIGELDGMDLSGFEAVWIRDGVDPENPACPGRMTIPTAAGEAKLVDFVVGGGGLYIAGDSTTGGLTSFVNWRDGFLSVELGAGDVDGACDCAFGNALYPDNSQPINTLFEPVVMWNATSVITPVFNSIGHGTPLVYVEPAFDGDPVGIAFDEGDLDHAPLGRVVVLNNNNNINAYDLWAVNIAAFLTGAVPCRGDVTFDGAVDLADLNVILANFGSQFGPGDLDCSGAVDLADLNTVLAEFGGSCD